MTTYASILLYAIPAFLGLIFIEWGISLWLKKSVFTWYDTISSLSSGVTNIIKDILKISIAIITYEWMFTHLSLIHIEVKTWHYLAAFIVLDFGGYWSHRFEHRINFLWNRHIIHHSSEEFNLACALRQSISTLFALFTFLLLPAALIGIDPKIIAIVGPLHLFAQFWYHTRLIGRMGWLEYVIVTPSHHRVHHAINSQYIDKNFGQIFIFWDKWFGTFQEELSSVPPVYGVTVPVNTWNPLWINFTHLWQMIRDAWRATSWIDKGKIFFMPTGWRPKDVEIAFPVQKIEDLYQYTKYHIKATPIERFWIGLQFCIMMLLLAHFLWVVDVVDFPYLLLYGLFIACHIFSYTSLMDRHWSNITFEAMKWAIFLYVIGTMGTWMGGVPVWWILVPLVLSTIVQIVLTLFYINRKESVLYN